MWNWLKKLFGKSDVYSIRDMYKVIDTGETFNPVEITKGPYKGVKISFGSVGIDDSGEIDRIRYDYDVTYPSGFKMTDSREFGFTMTNILMDLIEREAQALQNEQ